MKLTNSNVTAIGYRILEDTQLPEIKTIVDFKKSKGRYYEFKIDKFLGMDEIKELGISENDMFIHNEFTGLDTTKTPWN